MRHQVTQPLKVELCDHIDVQNTNEHKDVRYTHIYFEISFTLSSSTHELKSSEYPNHLITRYSLRLPRIRDLITFYIL